MRCQAFCLPALAVVLAVPATAQQSSRPYAEGPVTNVQFIRVRPGHFDDYMAFLAGAYKQSMDAQKKAGIITDWAVYNSDSRDESDWNIALATTYKNMAALDDLPDRLDAINKQVYGSIQKASEGMVKRGEMREIVGERLLRQLIIK